MDKDNDSINILEGGSPFYIRTLLRQINDLDFDDSFFLECKEEAKKIVHELGSVKAYEKLQEIS